MLTKKIQQIIQMINNNICNMDKILNIHTYYYNQVNKEEEQRTKEEETQKKLKEDPRQKAKNEDK